MLQNRIFKSPLWRVPSKSRRPRLIFWPIMLGVVVTFLASCTHSSRASGTPVRDLRPTQRAVAEKDTLDSLNDWVGLKGSAEPAVREGEEEDSLQIENCRTAFDPDRAQSDLEQQSPVRLVLDAVRVAQDDDVRCGERSTEAIYCRALWLIEVLDPVTIAFDQSVSTEERGEAAAGLDWSLTAAIEATSTTSEGGEGAVGEETVLEGSVAEAFAQLRPLTADLAQALRGVDARSRLSSEHEERLALLVGARAHPTIIDSLSAMQTVCMLGI